MRALTTQEQAVFSLGHFSPFARVDIDRDGDGTYQDMTSLSGFDWFVDAVRRESVDDPVASATVHLWREMGPLGYAGNGAPPLSISPLVQSSPLNKVDGVYTPLIATGRSLRVYVAMMPHLMQPAASDWRLVFDGFIDTFDIGGEVITLECRDLGGRVQDAFIEGNYVLGSTDGTPVETSMQELLDAVLGAGAVTLQTDESPGWNIHSYLQARTFVLEALRQLAAQIGWDLRYLWDADGDAFALSFYEPDRAKTSPDLTLSASQYVALPKATISREKVRNAGRLWYTDPATGARMLVTSEDSNSIEKYGRRVIEIGEASTSNIDSATEAQAMIDAVIADLSEPLLEQSAELPYLYSMGLGDLVRFSSNGVTFDSDQDLAVVTIEDSLTRSSAKTTVGLRGKPSGGFERWLAHDIRNGVFPRLVCDIGFEFDRDYPYDPPLAHSSTQMTWWDVVYSDEAGMFDETNGRVIVPVTGLYDIVARISDTALPAGGIGDVRIWRNKSLDPPYDGDLIAYDVRVVASGSTTTPTAIVKGARLNAGDWISTDFQYDSPNSVILAGQAYTRLTVTLIPGAR